MRPEEGWIGPRPTNNNPFPDGEVKLRVGELYGARTFLTDTQGNLAGATYKRIWSPGVNEAECWKITGWHVANVGTIKNRPSKRFVSIYTGRMLQYGDNEPFPEVRRERSGWTWEIPETNETGVTHVEPKAVYGYQGTDHDLAECDCGLHSYLRGSLSYASRPDSISGVIRAFGRIWVGERGFRASHAEIVALYLPDQDPGAVRIPVSAPLSESFGAVAPKVTPEVAERISAKYPAVPIYHDLEGMLALHPTD